MTQWRSQPSRPRPADSTASPPPRAGHLRLPVAAVLVHKHTARNDDLAVPREDLRPRVRSTSATRDALVVSASMCSFCTHMIIIGCK